MPPRRIKVSEKSLELNVCAELLQCIRSRPDCRNALWFGLTQSQEKAKGLDELMLNVPREVLLMLQFKAPAAALSSGSPYRFRLNVAQFKNLLILADRFPEQVCYVFPLYREWAKAGEDAPDLAQDTWLMPVACMPQSVRNLRVTSRHSSFAVDVVRMGSDVKINVRSETVVGKAFSISSYCRRPDVTGIPASGLQEWVQELDQGTDVPILERPGGGALCALFVP